MLSKFAKYMPHNIQENNIIVGYGGTFDGYDLPIDEIRYWLFMHLYKKFLESKGKSVKLVYIIADKGVFHNYGENKETCSWRAKRISQIKALNKFFNNEFEVMLQSEIKITKDDIKNVNYLTKRYNNLLEKTIPPSRISQERKRKYLYTLEELLTFIKITNGKYLIKVGPPREVFYDKLIKILKRKFSPLYLKPVYPVNCTWAYYLYRSDVREFGLTPYKVGDKGYLEKRILITDDVLTIKYKISNTRVSKEYLPEVLSPYYDLVNLYYYYKNKNVIIDDLANELYKISKEVMGHK